jgi:hypothetical protein
VKRKEVEEGGGRRKGKGGGGDGRRRKKEEDRRDLTISATVDMSTFRPVLLMNDTKNWTFTS